MLKAYMKVPLWIKILIGLIVGIIVGTLAGEKALYIKWVGDIFVNAIKMLIVPLILSSLVVGVTSIDDIGKMGRIGLKTIIIYVITTMIAIAIGLTLGIFSKIGVGINIDSAVVHPTIKAVKTGLFNIDSFIPPNPIAAMANGDILAIIIFAIILGISINLAGESAFPVKSFFNGFAETMYKMTSIIMGFAPFGVAALMAVVIGRQGISFIIPLLKVVGIVYLACFIHAIVIIGGGIFIVGRLNPIKFFKGFLDAIILAFSMSSSSGALPVSMQCAKERLGVSDGISSFVLPLGATVNMNGTAIYQGVCAIFIANIYGIHLSVSSYLAIMITSVLAAVGTAGIPGAGLIMLTLVLKAAGLPLEGIAIIAGIDRIMDMARSCINVMGDGMAAVIVAKSEKELNYRVYNEI